MLVLALLCKPPLSLGRDLLVRLLIKWREFDVITKRLVAWRLFGLGLVNLNVSSDSETDLTANRGYHIARLLCGRRPRLHAHECSTRRTGEAFRKLSYDSLRNGRVMVERRRKLPVAELQLSIFVCLVGIQSASGG